MAVEDFFGKTQRSLQALTDRCEILLHGLVNGFDKGGGGIDTDIHGILLGGCRADLWAASCGSGPG
jgi:hypothetical protein